MNFSFFDVNLVHSKEKKPLAGRRSATPSVDGIQQFEKYQGTKWQDSGVDKGIKPCIHGEEMGLLLEKVQF